MCLLLLLNIEAIATEHWENCLDMVEIASLSAHFLNLLMLLIDAHSSTCFQVPIGRLRLYCNLRPQELH